MKTSYDFSRAKKNPYARRLTRRYVVHLDLDAASRLEALAAEAGMPVETLMRLALIEHAERRRRASGGRPAKRVA